MQKYYQNECKFKDVYSYNKLSKTLTYGAYLVNLDEYKSVGTLWINLYANDNSVTYFDSFGVEHIPK